MPELEATFGALSDPTRLAIVRMLLDDPRRPSEIAEHLDVSRAVTSRHLRILHRAGLVEAVLLEGDARGRMYTLARGPFDEVREFIDQVEAFWGDQLAAFKAHAEARHGD